jgi:hypothetical protein
MDNSLYEDWIEPLGKEYPAAVTSSGIRIPLAYETRFKRHYTQRGPGWESDFDVSRFVDGSASITLPQLKEDWSTWTDADRADLCDSMHDLENIGQQDFAEIVGFLLDNANPAMLGPVVLHLPVTQTFPPDETFQILLEVLQRSNPGHAADVIRAMGKSHHSDAEATIRRHLRLVVADAAAWADANHYNTIALDAAYCIFSLLELGAPAVDFVDIVRRLSEHACGKTREWCRRNFSKHYAWLREPPHDNQV